MIAQKVKTAQLRGVHNPRLDRVQLQSGRGRPGLHPFQRLSGFRFATTQDSEIVRKGGTGAARVGSYPPFTPVLTTLALHAEKRGNTVTGSLDCMALAPESGVSFTSQSAQFTVNAMYVTGQVTGGGVQGDTATLTGTANVTGLGAASNTPFTFVVTGGGLATAVLTVSGLVFNEVLLDGGSFQVGSN